MYRSYVSSSNLHSVGYDELSSTLEIEFNSGDIYRYYRVSPGVYNALMSASSKGIYFARFIRYTYEYALVA